MDTKTIDTKTIESQIKDHELWLKNKTHGKRLILKDTTFYCLTLNDVNLQGAVIINANVIESDFKRVNFENANLKNMTTYMSNFSHANFKNANLNNCFIEYSNFWQSTFEGVNCYDSHFWKSTFGYANFFKSNLEKTSFLKCYVEAMNIKNANLTNTVIDKTPDS